MKSHNKTRSKNLFQNPWPFFWLFALVNGLLAYVPLPLQAKLWIGFLGWLLPLGLWISSMPKASPLEEPPYRKELFSSPSPWVWFLVLALGGLTRFYRLTTFLDYPLLDEINNALCAIRLKEKWTWEFFFNWSQLPPFYIWLLAGVYKVAGVSFVSLWGFPAFLSAVSIFFFYKALRPRVSRSFAFAFLALLCIQFWPCFVGRFSHQAVLMFFWESVGFWILAKLFSKGVSSSQKTLPFLLGLWVGAGFYTYFGWPLVALLMGLTVWAGVRKGILSSLNMSWFLAGSVLAVAPLILAALQADFGGYLSSIFWSHPNPENIIPWSPWRNLDYFTAFFWEGWKVNFAYNSQWGGFLNPIEGAFFFIGTGILWKWRRQALVRWVGLGFAVLFIPCLLANNTNWFHVISLIPFFMGTVVLGFFALLSRIRIPFYRGLLGLVLLLSFGLDMVNLSKSRDAANRDTGLPEMFQTYHLLERLQSEKGPGYIFTRFVRKPWTPYIDFGTYSFNLLHGQARKGETPWVGLLTNVNYQPFLEKRFPGGKVYWLNKNHPPSDGGLMLWVSPLTPALRETLDLWKSADRALNPFWDQFNYLVPHHGYDDLRKSLCQASPWLQGDPFLESAYGEMESLLCFQQNFLKALHVDDTPARSEIINQPVPEALLNESALKESLSALEYASKHGYPAAHLYYQQGIYWLMAGNKHRAKRAFQRAIKAPLDLTDSRKFLP